MASDNEVVRLTQNLVALRAAVVRDMGSLAENFLIRFPIDQTIEMILALPPVRSYDFLSKELADHFKELEQEADCLINARYRKLILIDLMLKGLPRIPSRIPLATQRRYLGNFNRIYSDCCAFTDQNQELVYYRNDAFLKNLGVCSLFVLPLGAQKVNKNRLPLYWLKEVSGSERIDFLGKYAFKLRGLSPFYDMHTDSQDKELLEEFNETGWRNFLLELAELMLLERDVLGAYGIGWFFDPKVWEVSPRLSYLGDIIKETNGHIYRAGENQSAVESALATSPTRRSLYEQKLYIPCNYIAIWDRTALLQWHSCLSGF